MRVSDVTVVETGGAVSTPLLVTTAPSEEQEDLDSTGERLGRKGPSPAKIPKPHFIPAQNDCGQAGETSARL